MEFFRSKTGKLLVGGCGVQVGLVSALAGVVIIILFCGICAIFNVLSFSLVQPQSPAPEEMDVAGQPASATSEEEVALLREEVELLVGTVRQLQTNTAAVPTPIIIPPPLPPKPLAIASRSAANLRSGPGMNYPRIGRLPLGESMEIVGRNSDSSWWLVATPNGSVAWVANTAVTATYADAGVPVVSIPALLVQPAGQEIPAGPSPAFPTILPSTGQPTPAPPPVAGTPTAAAQVSRRFVQDTPGYKQVVRRLLLPTVSESFSPDGRQIAITERIKLYTITTAGQSKRVLLEDNETIDLVGAAVWSPDGRYLAFVANRIGACEPCRTVGLVQMSNGEISYLQAPQGAGLDMPRWTQDGQLLVTVFWDEPANGATYLFNTAGQGQEAAGTFVLSSSHDGQKWFPWLPGKTWSTGPSQPAGSYYGD